MSLQSNNAVILFGAPNDKNTTVSKQLSDLGIMMLRSAPSALNEVVLHDRNQPEYAFYMGNFSAYLQSWIQNEAVFSTLSGYPSKIPLAKTIPLDPPCLIMGWRTAIADEVKEDIIKNHGGIPVMTQGGKPGLSVHKETIAEYAAMGSYHPDPIFPSIDDHFNLNCLRHMATSIRLVSAAIQLQHYPAWQDKDHFENYLAAFDKDASEVDPSSTMDIDNVTATIGPKLKGTIRATGVKYRYDSPLNVVSFTADAFPNGSGLYCPYFADLALFDHNAVPGFIERFMLRSLGESTGDIAQEMKEIRSVWGVLSKTMWGKELSHIATCAGWALKAQGHCCVIMADKVYKGCVISGESFSITIKDKTYRPVPFEELQKAVADSDTHKLAVTKIVDFTTKTTAEKAAMVLRVIKRSSRLQAELLKEHLKEEDMADLMKYARLLSFPGERFWPINVNTITKALDTIVNEEISLDGYPIHHSQILSTNRSHVVWSCFGGMAPSFLIPGGRVLDLSSNLKISVTVQKKGGRSEVQETALSRVACRNVLLEKALKDLDEVRTSKKIQSPFAQSNVRRSQANQDRFFAGAQGQEVVGSLRKFCRISETSTTSKRKAEGQPEDGPSDPKKRFLDLF